MAVFICYRRDDAEGEARALQTRLLQDTSARNVFLDHDTIEVGQDWRQRIDDALSRMDAALIVIGPRWIEALQGRSARGEPDVVRQEVAACLGRRGLLVVPVLVKGAAMPRAEQLPDDMHPLLQKNAIELRGSAWKDDTARLVKLLRKSKALPVRPVTWVWRGLAAASVPGLAALLAWALVPVPNIPKGMTKSYARQAIEGARLSLEAVQVEQAQFGGYVVKTGTRGMSVAASQDPPAGAWRLRGQRVKVGFIRLEPYRLMCRGGGRLAQTASGPDLRFERFDAAWSLAMPPGHCAWVTGALHPNQDLVLRPLGFAGELAQAFERAPGNTLSFCAYSEYDQANAKRSERLVAVDFRQALTRDDRGQLVPTTAGHVCDEQI